MNFAQHARGGLTASIVVTMTSFIYFRDFDRSLLRGLMIFTGSLFPDLDTDSKPSKWAARIGLVVSVVTLALNKPYIAGMIGTMFFFVKSGRHRGFIHKYHFPAICFILTWGTGNLFYAAFGLGLVVHFWLDGISPIRWRNWI